MRLVKSTLRPPQQTKKQFIALKQKWVLSKEIKLDSYSNKNQSWKCPSNGKSLV